MNKEIFARMRVRMDAGETLKNTLKGRLAAQRPRKVSAAWKKLAVSAAAVCLVICIMAAIGFSNIAGAAKRVFYIIKGYEIVESSADATYRPLTLDGNDITVSTKYYDLTLLSAKTSDNMATNVGTQAGIMINVSVAFKGRAQNADFEQLTNADRSDMLPFIKINIGKTSYSKSAGEYGGGSTCGSGENGFTSYGNGIIIPKDKLNTDTTYTLVYEGALGDISLDFKLREPETADESGAVSAVMRNNIKVTAIKDADTVTINGVECIRVDVYAENKSYYQMAGIYSDFDNYPRFETARGSVDPIERTDSTFYFDASKISQGDTFVLPGFYAYRAEDLPFELTIPAPGESAEINLPFLLREASLTLTSVTPVKDYILGDNTDIEPIDGIIISFASKNNSALRPLSFYSIVMVDEAGKWIDISPVPVGYIDERHYFYPLADGLITGTAYFKIVDSHYDFIEAYRFTF